MANSQAKIHRKAGFMLGNPLPIFCRLPIFAEEKQIIPKIPPPRQGQIPFPDSRLILLKDARVQPAHMGLCNIFSRMKQWAILLEPPSRVIPAKAAVQKVFPDFPLAQQEHHSRHTAAWTAASPGMTHGLFIRLI